MTRPLRLMIAAFAMVGAPPYGREEDYCGERVGNCRMIPEKTMSEAMNPEDPLDQQDAMQEVADLLRAGDIRLYRSHPSRTTWSLMQRVVKAGMIEALPAALQSEDWSLRGTAAEMVHLLCTDSPANRENLAGVGVIPLLLPLLRAGISEPPFDKPSDRKLRACEEAGEAVWILAFAGTDRETEVMNSADHHNREDGLHASEMVETLGDVVMMGQTCKARMWAAAALGNLVARYESVPEEMTEATRKELLERPGLVEELVKMADFGPTNDLPKDKQPGAALNNRRFTKELMSWGALHALKSLSISKNSHERLRAAGAAEVGHKLFASVDFVEQFKAGQLLRHLEEKVNF